MPTGNPKEKFTDAIVVGGGPAGLSAAIYLARYDRTVAVFDAGHGRSTHRQVNHNYLGFPGGVAAVKLRELGKAQLAEYEQVDFEAHKVLDCVPDGDGFVAWGQFGSYRATHAGSDAPGGSGTGPRSGPRRQTATSRPTWSRRPTWPSCTPPAM